MQPPERDLAPNPAYLLGHSPREIERLKWQARLIAPITRRYFREAGLMSGMRVLEVGSGAGDVAFLVADLVGEHGAVVGVDRSAAALDTARARASAARRHNVTFLEGDPGDMAFDLPFDAVVGRYVLQFQPDPAAMLRRLTANLRPGGVVAFHEIDWGGGCSYPPVPTFDRCYAWGHETLRRYGTETHMGCKLNATFLAAGLAAPAMRLEAVVGGGGARLDVLELVASLVGALLPEMERLGVASAEEVGIDTLLERMCAEAEATASVVVGHYQVGAWTRV